MKKEYVLIIDTSRAGIGLALGTVDNKKTIISEYISTSSESSSGKQSVELPTAVEKFLEKQSLNFSNLNSIGVVVGPGSFTGIRLGIAYAKGLAIGLKIPVLPINTFEIYLEEYPDAFVAIDTGRGDLFVSAHNIDPCTMIIDEVETRQMDYPKTVGHKPYDLRNTLPVIQRKLESKKFEPVIPMYLRPSYAELNCKC